jgi:hypothetical protein
MTIYAFLLWVLAPVMVVQFTRSCWNSAAPIATNA